MSADAKTVLLIVTGGIAAYKTPELIRLLRRAEVGVTTVLTEAAKAFVTPLTLGSVSGGKIYSDLFDLTAEQEMGHIALGRVHDLILVAPATADFIAKLALGLAGDLATTTCLATNRPILIAPAMNVRMWEHPATQAHVATLRARGVMVVEPQEGEMACGEYGVGRMAEPADIWAAVQALLLHNLPDQRLSGMKALVTAGPTHEPLDAVRFLANRSSGKQGYAIAAALARAGAQVTLVSGPTSLMTPAGVNRYEVETAEQMLAASLAALPADVAICAAAVSDWRLKNPNLADKWKRDGASSRSLDLIANPDILASLAAHPGRPSLLVGFALETGDVAAQATKKRIDKGCDWILANRQSPEASPFGSEHNEILLVTANSATQWPKMTKAAVADKLALEIFNWKETASWQTQT
jgi:phosphopantothenoylcysteine decarboxylase/phosphopantothenate--cysteine ligase